MRYLKIHLIVEDGTAPAWLEWYGPQLPTGLDTDMLHEDVEGRLAVTPLGGDIPQALQSNCRTALALGLRATWP